VELGETGVGDHVVVAAGRLRRLPNTMAGRGFLATLTICTSMFTHNFRKVAISVLIYEKSIYFLADVII
jgi:hypothetical protein